MGKYYTIPNHNAKFTNSFKERPANELQDVVRFFSLQDNQDLLDSYQARPAYVFSPVLKGIMERELSRRKHFTEPKDKVLVIPVPHVSLSVLEKVVQLTISGFTDITKQPFSSQDFENALVNLQIPFLTDDHTKGRSSHCGSLVKDHSHHSQPTMAMSMISGDDYYPAGYIPHMHHESSNKKGKGRTRGRPAVASVVDSDSNSSEYVPKQKRNKSAVRAIVKPDHEKTIWRCGFDCPGVFFYSLREQTAHHADVHKVDFGEDRRRK